jgi:hypothetical protein
LRRDHVAEEVDESRVGVAEPLTLTRVVGKAVEGHQLVDDDVAAHDVTRSRA